jgi:predicted lactoylglutathione lyase
MSTSIFINLPVKDLKKSMDFYTQIGFQNNPQFTDDTAACMMYTETIFVMLLTHNKFKEFSRKTIADTKTTAAVINSLSVDNAEGVNSMVEKALQAGGSEPTEAKDYGFMQQRSFEDIDGHLWEVIYMDMTKLPH